MSARFKHNGITDSTIELLIMAVISGSGSKSRDLTGDLAVRALTSTSEADRNISLIFTLKLISAYMEILQVFFGRHMSPRSSTEASVS